MKFVLLRGETVKEYSKHSLKTGGTR